MIFPSHTSLPRLARRTGALLFAIALAAPSEAPAQEPAAARDEQSPEDGQRISEYDFAVSHAMRALMAAGPEQGRVTVYVARKEGELWHVYFGSYDVRDTAFRIAYEVVQQEPGSRRFTVGKYARDVPADEELDRAATALVNALDAFEPRTTRFYTYVWRDDRDRWVTYFSASPQDGPSPDGARPGLEQRVVLSPDARRVLESRAFPGGDRPVVWIPPGEPPAPTVAEFVRFFLDPSLAPLTLIGHSLVCEMNWRGELENCLIGPPR